jgi:tRNA A37 threonylcarbamoyladenosine synthetase subunit TsaC/SUA5/YrdC
MLILNCLSSPENLVVEKAVEVLSRGGLVIFPTETCYGAGVDAKCDVAKLLKYKRRPTGKRTVAVASCKMASRYVNINDAANKSMMSFTRSYNHFQIQGGLAGLPVIYLRIKFQISLANLKN